MAANRLPWIQEIRRNGRSGRREAPFIGPPFGSKSRIRGRQSWAGQHEIVLDQPEGGDRPRDLSRSGAVCGVSSLASDDDGEMKHCL